MRILINRKNTKYDARKFYEHDFYAEIAKRCDADFSYIRKRGRYDVVIGGINPYGLSVKIQRDIHEGVGVDSPQHRLELINRKPWDIILMRYMHITCPGIPKTYYVDNLKAKAVFFPYSLSPKRWAYSEEKDNDVVFLGTTVEKMYPLRHAIRNALPLPYKTIAGNLPMAVKRDGVALKKKHTGVYAGESYIRALQRSKVMLTDASKYGCPVMKYFEAISTGCLLMADRPHYADEIGLIDGETFVEISKDNWREKLDYYLANDTERLRIARNARELFEARHTNKIRVKELINILNA